MSLSSDPREAGPENGAGDFAVSDFAEHMGQCLTDRHKRHEMLKQRSFPGVDANRFADAMDKLALYDLTTEIVDHKHFKPLSMIPINRNAVPPSGAHYAGFLRRVRSRKALVVQFTRRCNIKCAHCLVDSHDKRRDVVDRNLLKQALEEARSLGYDKVMFTGGEPLAYRKNLMQSLEDAKALGFRSSVATNGAWGRHKERAARMLAELVALNVNRIALSSGDFHLEHVPLEWICNILDAGRKFPQLKFHMKLTGINETARLAEYLAAHYPEVTVRDLPLIPEGRATALSDDHFNMATTTGTAGRCSDVCRPFLDVEGNVWRCCNVDDGKDPELHGCIGKMQDGALGWLKDDVLRKMLFLVGPSGIIRMLRERGVDTSKLDETRFASTCDLCASLLNDEAYYLPVVALAADPGVAQDLDRMERELAIKAGIQPGLEGPPLETPNAGPGFGQFSAFGRDYAIDTDSNAVFRLSPEARAVLENQSDHSLAPSTPAEREFTRLRTAGFLTRSRRPKPLPGLKPIQSLNIFLTFDCNLRCTYCYEFQEEEKALPCSPTQYLTEEQARKTIDFLLAESGQERELRISLFGGEPLLNRKVFRFILEYATRAAEAAGKTIEFSMTTNGTIFSKRVLALIKKYRIKLLISFDGPPEIQDRQRPFKNGKGSYDKVARNIRRFREAGVTVELRATLAECSENIPQVTKYMDDHQMGNFILTPASGRLAPSDEGVDGEIVHMLSDRLAGREGEGLDGYGNIQMMADKLRKGTSRSFGCGAAIGQYSVGPDGRIYPCHRFVGLDEYVLGDIETGVNEAKRRDFALQNYIPSRPKCMSCWARHYCGGGCAYINQQETGALGVSAESRCRSYRKTLAHVVPVVEDRQI